MPYCNISIKSYSKKSIITQLLINLNYKFAIFAMDVIAFICLYFIFMLESLKSLPASHNYSVFSKAFLVFGVLMTESASKFFYRLFFSDGLIQFCLRWFILCLT